MTSKKDIPISAHEFAGLTMKRILEHPLPGETPTSRMKQIGVINLIYQMQTNNIKPTVNNIMKLSQLGRDAVLESTGPLVKRKLLIEEQTLNTGGRGRAFVYVIPPDVISKNPFIRLGQDTL